MALKLSPCCAPAAKELSLKFSIPTAQLFLHRYYAVKCMQRNDRFIVACACLFLAAKVEEDVDDVLDRRRRETIDDRGVFVV